jgi:hypothetical protein
MAEPKIIKDTTLAYLAGMIDGDGYITINRSDRAGKIYHAPQVGIAGTRREPHDLAASLWGGKVGCYYPTNTAHRPQFQWSRQGAQAAEIIKLLQPFLLIKIEHAWLALNLWEHIQEGRSSDPFPWYGPHFEPICERDEMREHMIEINQSRNRIGKKAAGRLLDGVEHNGTPS